MNFRYKSVIVTISQGSTPCVGVSITDEVRIGWVWGLINVVDVCSQIKVCSGQSLCVLNAGVELYRCGNEAFTLLRNNAEVFVKFFLSCAEPFISRKTW